MDGNCYPNNKNDFLVHNSCTLINEKIVDLEDYLEKMKQNSFYAGNLEISKKRGSKIEYSCILKNHKQ